MCFKKRYIEEDYTFPGAAPAGPSFKDKIKEGAKDHWGKLLGAGALGALAATGAITHSDDLHDTIDQWHQMDNNDTLWNHFMDKAKSGLEHLKTGETGGLENEAGSSGGLTNFFSSRHGGNEADLTKLKALALPYAAENNDINFDTHARWFGLKSSNDIGASDLSDQDVARETANATREYAQNVDKYQKALHTALKDNQITPDEKAQLDALREKIEGGPESNLGVFDKLKGMFYGQDRVLAERQAEQELENAYNWARQNNLDFLTKGSLDDDVAYFESLRNKLGYIPKELVPIYRDVMRQIRS